MVLHYLVLHLKKPWIPFTQVCFVPRLFENGSVFLEKRVFLNVINVFLLFRNYLPLEKSGVIQLKKLIIKLQLYYTCTQHTPTNCTLLLLTMLTRLDSFLTSIGFCWQFFIDAVSLSALDMHFNFYHLSFFQIFVMYIFCKI